MSLTHLDYFLYYQSRQRHSILGYGTCMFRAVSHQLYVTEHFHAQLRSVSHCISSLNKTSQNMKHTGWNCGSWVVVSVGYRKLFPNILYNNSRVKLFVTIYASHYLFARQIHWPEPTAEEGLPRLHKTAHLMWRCLPQVCHSLSLTCSQHNQRSSSLWQRCAILWAFSTPSSSGYHSKTCRIHWLDLLNVHP